MTAYVPAIFDLVGFAGASHTVCGTSDDGRTMLSSGSWPVEFSELDGHVRPHVVLAEPAQLFLEVSGPERLAAVCRLITATEESASITGSLDWNEVDQALEAAREAFPAQLLDIDMDDGSWRLADIVPDHLRALASPVAVVLATHAYGSGDAEISDIERATALAHEALGTSPPEELPSLG